MRALDHKMRQLDQRRCATFDEGDATPSALEALGRQMEDASRRAEQQMLELVDRAISTGLAGRVGPSPEAAASSGPLDRFSRLNRSSRLGRLERSDRLARLNRFFDWL